MTKDTDDDIEFGFFEADCVACEVYTKVNDIGLCEDCDAKVDRDLIRNRDWDYSSSAFGCPVDRREELRNHVIANYGEALELLVAEPPPQEQSKARKRKRKRKR